MLELNRLNGEKVWINPDQIKFIFKSPDTTLVFTDGSSLMVKDAVQEIEEQWSHFRKMINKNALEAQIQFIQTQDKHQEKPK